MKVDLRVPSKLFPRMRWTCLLMGSVFLVVVAACGSSNNTSTSSSTAATAPTTTTRPGSTAATAPTAPITTTRAPITTTRPGSTAPTAPTTTTRPANPFDDPFRPVTTGTAGYVQANATWRAPPALNAEQSDKIGLSIGQSQALTSEINGLLPKTNPTPAGQVTVGPFVRVRLEANPADADVVPSDFVNESTTSDINLLWTWIVTPKKPTSSLVMIAHVEVPLAGSTNVLSTDVPFPSNIPVNRTFGYAVHQIFTNWATLSAIGAAVLGGVAWIIRLIIKWRRRRNQRSSEPSSGTDAPPRDGPNGSSESGVKSTGPLT